MMSKNIFPLEKNTFLASRFANLQTICRISILRTHSEQRKNVLSDNSLHWHFQNRKSFLYDITTYFNYLSTKDTKVHGNTTVEYPHSIWNGNITLRSVIIGWDFRKLVLSGFVISSPYAQLIILDLYLLLTSVEYLNIRATTVKRKWCLKITPIVLSNHDSESVGITLGIIVMGKVFIIL